MQPNALYYGVLGRTPDAGGYNYWSSYITQVGFANGMKEMINGGEFQARMAQFGIPFIGV